MGFYRSAGLRVNVTALNNSGALSSAIASGAIQIGSFAISIGALARERGLPLTMIAPAGLYLSSTPTSGLIVAKNSPIRKAADCNGKTIATRDLSNMSYFGAKQWIDKNGGDSKSVRWIEIPDTSTVAAIGAGRIDAATISEPSLDDALRGGDVRSLGSVFDAIAKRFLISGYFTTEQFAAAHPDIVRRFAAVISSTAVWANKNRPATAKILEKYVQAPVAPDSLRTTYAERLLPGDVQPVLDVLLDYGFLKTPMRARDLFSPLATG
jgi:NitT/TauT family transport system substrate-binding protein